MKLGGRCDGGGPGWRGREGIKDDKNVSYSCVKFSKNLKNFYNVLWIITCLEHCCPLPTNFVRLPLHVSGRTVRLPNWREGHFLSNDPKGGTSEAAARTSRVLPRNCPHFISEGTKIQKGQRSPQHNTAGPY